jgi:ubiquinol-cytochrome c reductase cytochrome b subunit
MWKNIKEGFDTRFGLKSLFESRIRGYSIPAGTNIFYTLGLVALFAYMMQAVTGYFLLMYYIPHTEYAFDSTQIIMNVVPYGWLVRMVHIVASNLMLVVLMLHLISIFIMGSYKKPREITWLAGGLLLLVTLAFCLSGYLLPWSQRSYWATTIVTTMPTALPVIGDFIANLLRGGDTVTGVTLNRFFALHVAFLPPIFLAITGIHVWMVWRIGLSVPPFSTLAGDEKPWTEYRKEEYRESHPFFPNFVLKEAFMITLFLAVTFFIISFYPMIFLPEAANVPADPFRMPDIKIKPEWYFLAPYQLIRLIPSKFFGISIQIIAIVFFLLWPFIDTKRERNILKRPLLLGSFVALLVLWFVLTIWGRYS